MATDAALAEGPSQPGSLSRWLFLQQQRFAWFLLIPALTILIPLFLFPLAILLRNSFNWDEPGAIMVEDFIVANYVRILTDSYYASLFGNSILVAGGVALLTLIIGYPFAYYLVRWAGERRNLLLWIIYTPLIVSVITRVFGWMVITADSGLINTLLMSMGVTEGPVHILFEVSGMVIGMVHRYLPLMILPLANSIAKIDTRILLASTSLGAGAPATFARVIIPLSLPGIVAGLQLVIAVVLSDFVLPTLLGTPRFRMLAPAIYGEAIANVRWASSAAMAILMVAVVVLILLSMNLVLRRAAPWAKSF